MCKNTIGIVFKGQNEISKCEEILDIGGRVALGCVIALCHCVWGLLLLLVRELS